MLFFTQNHCKRIFLTGKIVLKNEDQISKTETTQKNSEEKNKTKTLRYNG